MRFLNVDANSKYLLLSVLLLLTGIVYAIADEYSEKANHLYRFAKYVQWPKSKVLNVCVIGADPFGKKLDRVLAGRKIGGRTLTPKRLSHQQSVSDCHLLFVSKRLNDQQTKRILQRANRLTVTIGERSGFLQLGGIINFIKKNNKVRYEVNQSVAKKRGIKLTYRLIKHASRTR